MARVLIAWELGEAFGHLARCLRLAEGLRSRGHTVTLVLQETRLPAGYVPSPGICVMPAPPVALLTPPAGAVHAPQVNYADVLLASGFADAQQLAAQLNAWRTICSSIRPSLLVADHAPTALLSAHLAGIPHLTVGNGFVIPPESAPWPSIRPDDPVPESALIEAEVRLDRVVLKAQQHLGYAKPVRIRELFGEHDILDTFAELDHYGPRSKARYVGPIVTVPKTLRVDWQSQHGPKVLAYLRPVVPGFRAIMHGLSLLDADVLCVVPGLSTQLAKRIATQRMRIALKPVDLPHLLAGANLAVCYGNSGFSSQALLAGVPLAMRPRYVEQGMLSSRVEAIGAGRQLVGDLHAEKVRRCFEELLSEPGYRRSAQAFQQAHSDFTPQQSVEKSLAWIEQMLQVGQPSTRSGVS